MTNLSINCSPNRYIIEALLRASYNHYGRTKMQREVRKLLAKAVRSAYNLKPAEPISFHYAGVYYIAAGMGRSLHILLQADSINEMAASITDKLKGK